MQKRFTVVQAARLMGCHKAHLSLWLQKGFIPFEQDSPGTPRLLTTGGLLAVGVALALRREGASLPTIKPLCDYLGTVATDEMFADLRAGKTMLVSHGGHPAKLVEPGWKGDHEGQMPTMVVAIPLAKCAERLAERLIAMDSSKPEAVGV